MKSNGDRLKIMEKKEICSKNGNRPIDYVLIWANYILWIAIILFCLLFAIVGHCASSSSSTIPYNVAEMQSYNQIMLERLPIALQQYRQGHNIDENVPLLVWTDDGFYNNGFYAYVIMREPYLNPNYNYPEQFDFESNYIRFSSQYQIERILIGSNYTLQGWNINMGTGANLCGTAQSVPTSEGNYLPRYPFYYNGDPIIDSTFQTEVLISRVSGGIAVEGHATEPNLTDNDIDPLTQPDIDDYLPTPTTPPTVDTTSPSTLLNSIFDLLSWGFNLLNNTIKGTLTFLGDLLSYVGQKIIDNIKNGIKNLYDNFKSLFEPLLNGIAEILSSIKEGIDFIIKPFDPEEFEESWNNCQFISAVENIQDGYDEFKKAFEYAEERDYYTLYMGFMFTDYTVNAEFDFTWLYPLRPIYRPLLWGFVVYEMFVYMCSSFSDWLAGRSGNK